jgi:hypothetical protein
MRLLLDLQDDRSFLQHILAQASQAQQNEYNASLGQQLAPQLQNLLQRRQQPATPPVPTNYRMPCPAVPPFG